MKKPFCEFIRRHLLDEHIVSPHVTIEIVPVTFREGEFAVLIHSWESIVIAYLADLRARFGFTKMMDIHADSRGIYVRDVTISRSVDVSFEP